MCGVGLKCLRHGVSAPISYSSATSTCVYARAPTGIYLCVHLSFEPNASGRAETQSTASSGVVVAEVVESFGETSMHPSIDLSSLRRMKVCVLIFAQSASRSPVHTARCQHEQVRASSTRSKQSGSIGHYASGKTVSLRDNERSRDHSRHYKRV